MKILVIAANRNGRVSSIEDRETQEDPENFQSSYSTDPARFTVKSVSCTESIFNQITPLIGTRQTPFLMVDVSSSQKDGIMNVYVENGSLKKAS